MKVYNTLSGKKEEFVPIKDKFVGMYVCGPTVYDKGHLGHARSMIVFDMVRRYLEYKGFEVKFVTNYTDIDDKMINRAAEEGITVPELAERIIPIYERDFAKLGIKLPSVQAKATEHVETMLTMIRKLLGADLAYVIEGDGVYFDVSKFSEYGKLSKQNLEELQHGARIAVKDQKRTPHDFVLWKFKKEGEPSWLDPDGIIAEGRPGWHIECSAMTYDLLGETFDIHGGGLDLTFPHHECEIAQSESFTGKGFAKYWMHNGFVNIEGEKMSKSLNNFKTIEDAMNVYHPLVIRYLLLSTHYRSPIDFTEALLGQAISSRNRLQEFYERVVNINLNIKINELDGVITKAETNFIASMDDDFEISGALGAVFALVKEVNAYIDKHGGLNDDDKASLIKFLETVNSVLGVINFEFDSDFSEEAKQLIEQRAEARENKDYGKSDELRDKLLELGVEAKDTPQGPVYKNKL